MPGKEDAAGKISDGFDANLPSISKSSAGDWEVFGAQARNALSFPIQNNVDGATEFATLLESIAIRGKVRANPAKPCTSTITNLNPSLFFLLPLFRTW